MILGISGSPVKRGSYFLLTEALKEVEKEGIKTDILQIADYNLEFCRGCNHCITEQECIINDDLEDIAEKLLEADGYLIASPSYFNSVTANLKNFFDRSRYLKMSNSKLENKLVAALATSGLRHGGGQITIEAIHRFALNHGMLVFSNSANPQTDSNLVIASLEKEEGWRKIKDDKKAIKAAQNLGSRMSYLLSKYETS